MLKTPPLPTVSIQEPDIISKHAVNDASKEANATNTVVGRRSRSNSEHKADEPKFVEPLLQPDENRFVMFPIVHHDVWALYKKAVDSFWKVEDVDLSKDLGDWEKLTPDEQYFIKMVLAFFSSSDGIIIENLSLRFSNEVQSAEVRAFYSFQNFVEAVHCVTGDTKILTNKGYFAIKDLLDQKVNIWNGDEFSEVVVKYTGDQEIYRIELSNGMNLDCTPGHKWLIRVGNQSHPEQCKVERIETKDLIKGNVIARYDVPLMMDCKDPDEFMNPYMHGFFCGDGSYCNKYPIIYLYHEKMKLLPHFKYDSLQTSKIDSITFYIHNYINKPKFEVPINYSLSTKLRWLEGYVDADGCISLNSTKDATGIQISSINLYFLKDVQLMLTTMGILSNLKKQKDACQTLLPKNDGTGEYDYYNCKECYIIYISTVAVSKLMNIGFSPNRLKLQTCERIQKLSNKNSQLIRVKSIDKISDKEKTYCFEEPKNHTGIFNGILTCQSEMYSQLIETYVSNAEEKTKLFQATANYPCIKKKADWGKKWITDHRSSFNTRLVAFAIIEGIFFSSSFAAIFWIKQKNLLPGLCLSNEYISRDESLHVDHAVLLYKKLKRKIPKKKFQDIMREAVEIEIEFITESIPCRMIGMNSDLMTEYVKFVADRLCVQLGYDKLFNATNPFAFMELISVEKKTNFFEHRVSEYALANKTMDDSVFDLNSDF
jgi:ribonucleotide reductase beta subunit family protein with ferritin-like domain